MPLDFIKYAFVAGEISNTFYGRSDLEKFDLGLALSRNWFVDYRGGMSTRPGSHFVDFVENDDEPTKFFRFAFAPSVSETFVLLFGGDYIRFIQAGSYVLEADKTITGITQASPGVVTSTSHGFSAGDWVKIFDVVGMTEVNARLFKVGTTAANTFQLLDPLTGANIDTSTFTAYASGGVANRVYTIASPYDPDDLELLRAHQTRDTIYLTHPDYAPRKLVRNSDISWTLSVETFTNAVTVPTGLALNDSATGAAGVGFVVTAINDEGIESLATRMVFEESTINYTTTEGSMEVTWNPVAGALYYNVYRTIILPVGTEVSQAMQVGYIGTAYGPRFVDNNIIPDFTTTPPLQYNPFADGQVLHVDVTAAGSGYTKASVVSFTGGGGTGAAAYPVVNAAGALLAIIMTAGGSGYTSAPTPSVSVGTGATFTVTRSPTSGNNPALNSVFQQRKIYAATDNQPLTIFGSRPRRFNNFDVSAISLPNDSYEFELDADEVAAIRHLFPTRAGLLAFTQTALWQLSAGPNAAVTPSNALADQQSYSGASQVPPLPVDTNILYIEGKGDTTRLLSYTDFTKLYSGQDVSILSNHLFKRHAIKAWAYAAVPNKLVWAVREDGALLCFTVVPEQNVFAWTQCWTKGLYEDVIAVQEDNIDVVYVMAKRLVNGRWTKMIEYLDQRDFEHVEDAWSVDAGLALEPTYPAASLTPAAATGNAIEFTASAAVFAAGDVGSIIRVGGGKATVVGFTSTTVVTCNIVRDIEAVIPEDEDNTPLVALAGEWTLDAPVTDITGLWHLEGETVKIVGDGNVLLDKEVSQGRILLETACTRVIIGLGFRCIAKTLPPTRDGMVVEDKRKNVKAVAVRLNDSRGLKAGPTLDALRELKERTTELPGEPTLLQQGTRYLTVPAKWNPEGQLYFVQDYPLPSSVLGIVQEIEVGDDQDDRF